MNKIDSWYYLFLDILFLFLPTKNMNTSFPFSTFKNVFFIFETNTPL